MRRLFLDLWGIILRPPPPTSVSSRVASLSVNDGGSGGN